MKLEREQFEVTLEADNVVKVQISSDVYELKSFLNHVTYLLVTPKTFEFRFLTRTADLDPTDEDCVFILPHFVHDGSESEAIMVENIKAKIKAYKEFIDRGLQASTLTDLLPSYTKYTMYIKMELEDWNDILYEILRDREANPVDYNRRVRELHIARTVADLIETIT